MKKISRIICGLLTVTFFGMGISSCSDEVTESAPAVTTTPKTKTETENNSNSDFANYVKTKYAKANDEARKSQGAWNMANCHDPKLFQDDDGTFYIYATDASCGNVENTGINIRYSTDLVNWTTLSKSAIQGHWDEDFLAWEGFKASSSEVKHNNSSYTAVTWAPTVIKQNGLYYMYHGVNADVLMSGNSKKYACSSIVLAIASSAKGPFYPASYISKYTGNDADIAGIKSKLSALGVSYSQNFLVRYCPYVIGSKGDIDGSTLTSNGASLDGKAISLPNYKECNNNRYGCIDPEFVYDVANGEIKKYTIGNNECYAITYGSWLNGIVLAYVDSVSLKPVALSEFTLDGKTYSEGDELDMSLDKAATTTSSISDRFALLGKPLIGGAASASTPSNGSSTAYEGAQLFYNGNSDYYYMISSCGGLMWEYRCALGRSRDINGPYLDAGGKDMWLGTTNYSKYHAIGSKIIGSHALSDEYSFRSQGGLSVLRAKDGKIMFACHTRTNYAPEYIFLLQLHQMFFNSDGWPILNQNDYYDNYANYTSDGKESLSALNMTDIAGTYDTILTVRDIAKAQVSTLGIYGADSVTDNVNSADAVPTKSKEITLDSNGNITGNYSGSWTLASDGYSVTINLKDAAGNALGTFKGYVLHAVDWARSSDYRTITFSTICSDTSAAKKGEYFWGNKKNMANLWATSADGNTLTFNDSSSASKTSNITVPAFNVSAANGFSFEFKATLPSTTNDWGAKILSYDGCYVTIPNLDPWNNTISGSTLTGKNAYPTIEGASLSSGLAYNSAFDGKEHTIKISFASNSIVFYLDGATWVTYSSSLWNGGISEFIGYYETAIKAGALTFNESGLTITSLKVTK